MRFAMDLRGGNSVRRAHISQLSIARPIAKQIIQQQQAVCDVSAQAGDTPFEQSDSLQIEFCLFYLHYGSSRRPNERLAHVNARARDEKEMDAGNEWTGAEIKCDFIAIE